MLILAYLRRYRGGSCSSHFQAFGVAQWSLLDAGVHYRRIVAFKFYLQKFYYLFSNVFFFLFKCRLLCEQLVAVVQVDICITFFRLPLATEACIEHNIVFFIIYFFLH